jgi:hypothetical protein
VLITIALEGNLLELLTCIGRRRRRVREKVLFSALSPLPSLLLCLAMFGDLQENAWEIKKDFPFSPGILL